VSWVARAVGRLQAWAKLQAAEQKPAGPYGPATKSTMRIS